MSAGPGVQYKFSQAGLDEIVSQVKGLHSELRDGTITYQQYNQQMKEVSAQGRAATQEFNQLKGAVAASNPEVLELTRTMSTFGSVANTVLSITNAINLAQMASMGIDQQVVQDKTQLAEAINQAAKDLAAFGPNSAQYQTDMSKVHALTNQLTYDQQQLSYQSISTGATIIASAVAAAGGVSQSYLGISAAIKSLQSDGTLLENIGIAFTAMGNAAVVAMTSIVAPILIAAAALYGLEAAAQAVFPQFKGYMSDLQSSIQSSWNVSGLEAYLISPFVGAYVDIIGIGSQIQQGLVSVYNGIITQFIDPLITAFDDTIGKITGQIQTINTIKMPTTPTTGSILSGLGINAVPGIAGTAAGQDTVTGTDTPTNQQLQLLQGTSTQQLQQLLQTGSTSSQILQSQQAAGAAIDAANSNLVTISTNVPEAINTSSAAQLAATNSGTTSITGAISAMSTAMTAGQTAQTAAVNAALASIQQQSTSIASQIATLQAQAAQLAAQPQTMAATEVQGPYNSTTVAGTVAQNSAYNAPGVTLSDTTMPTDAATQLEQVNQQIQQLQQQANAIQSQGQSIAANGIISGALDVSSSGVDAVLSSLGLSSSTGIGSIIAGALGGEGGIGGAGISQQQLQQFANTGDYGIFTQATLGDNANQQAQTTPTNEYNSLISSYEQMGFSTSQAAQYANAVKENSNNFNGNVRTPGNNGGYGAGSAYDYASATGFEGTTSGPTSFLAGEAGPEHVSITPLGSGGNGKTSPNITVSVVVQGTVTSESELANFIGDKLKEQLRAVGFT